MHILRFFTCFLMKLGIFGLVILALNLTILPQEIRAAEAVSAPASEADQAHVKALLNEIVALQAMGKKTDWPLETLGQCWDKIEELALYVEKHPAKYDIIKSSAIGWDYSGQIGIPGGREILTKMRKAETLHHEIRFIKKDGVSADWPIITLGQCWDKIEELALYVEQNPDMNLRWLYTLEVNPAYSVEIGTPDGRETLAKFRIADTLAYEIHHGSVGKADELQLYLVQNPEIVIALVSGLSPAAVSDIVKVDSIRHFLRGYKGEYGSTILEETYSYKKTFCRLLDAYLKDGMVTHDELRLGEVDLDAFEELSPEHQKLFFTQYRNQKGQNLLHLIKSSDFDKFKAAIGNDGIVDGLLIQPDHSGATPLMKFAARGDNFNAFQRALIEKSIDVEQVDIFGNTAEMFYRARKHKNPDQILAARHFERMNFNDSLWQSIKDEPCFLYMKEKYENWGEMTSSDFANVAFRTVLGQRQTPLHHAFLQHDFTDPDLRKQANALWRSFSDTYDTIEEISGRSVDRTLSLSRRALAAIYNSEFPDLQDTTASIISGTSSFGIKFRKATEDEAIAYVKGIKAFSKTSVSNWRLNALGRHLGLDVSGGTIEAKISVIGDHLRGSDPYDVNDGDLVEDYAGAHVTKYQTELEAAFDHEVNVIKRAFFKPSHKHLDPDKARHLFSHQLKCTVVALYDFSYEGYLLGHQRFASAGGAMDKDRVFDFIDEALADKMPVGVTVGSRVLFQNVKDHLGDSDYFLD